MLTACIFAAILASPGEVELAEKLPVIFEKSAAHYRAIDAAATPLMNTGDPKRNGWRAACLPSSSVLRRPWST